MKVDISPDKYQEFKEWEQNNDPDCPFATVKCQSCGKNKVRVIKNQPYFGILCGDCGKGHSYTTKNNTYRLT